jgi:hypothetical protein
LLIVVVETLHGVARQLVIVPALGDLPARQVQVGVFLGSALILLIAWWLAPWLDARTVREQLRVGALWVGLTVAFEVGLGLALGYGRARILADYDLTKGGLIPGVGVHARCARPWGLAAGHRAGAPVTAGAGRRVAMGGPTGAIRGRPLSARAGGAERAGAAR